MNMNTGSHAPLLRLEIQANGGKDMANKDNQSQRSIYIRSLKEKVPCAEQQFQEFYREATRIRKKEQYYHRCKCPKQFIWACDGDCENCEHHLGYGLLSLDAPNTEDGSTLLKFRRTCYS